MMFDLKQPRPLSVVLVSVYIFLLPLLLVVVFAAPDLLYFADILLKNWVGLLFYGVMGLCALSLNNKLRLGVVIMFSWMAAAPLIGLVMGIVQTWPMEMAIIRRDGIWILARVWFSLVGTSLLFALVPFYLTRPKVKGLFH